MSTPYEGESPARIDAMVAVLEERAYQERRRPQPAHSHEVESYLVYMRHYLRRAEDLTSITDCTHDLNKQKVMEEIRKIAALAVAAMEQHGVVHRT